MRRYRTRLPMKSHTTHATYEAQPKSVRLCGPSRAMADCRMAVQAAAAVVVVRQTFTNLTDEPSRTRVKTTTMRSGEER
jgi:hypothetical protein